MRAFPITVSEDKDRCILDAESDANTLTGGFFDRT